MRVCGSPDHAQFVTVVGDELAAPVAEKSSWIKRLFGGSSSDAHSKKRIGFWIPAFGDAEEFLGALDQLREEVDRAEGSVAPAVARVYPLTHAGDIFDSPPEADVVVRVVAPVAEMDS